MYTIASTIPAAALALASAVLSSCSTATIAKDPEGDQRTDANALTKQALTYVGDPWEKRFRTQFWSGQHVHDSWNPCHIGENVPTVLQGSDPDCWSRVPGRR